MPRQTLEFLSPCFCGGAANKTGPAELRVPSLRGQLRYWTRVIFHSQEVRDAAARVEHRLFGGIRAKKLGFKHPIDGQPAPEALASRFAFRLNFRGPPPQQSQYSLCPHDPTSGLNRRGKGWQLAIPELASFDLEWENTHPVEAGDIGDLTRVMKAWVLLGSLGLRGNRCSGSVWRDSWVPADQQFLDCVNGLRLHARIVVRVLRPLTNDDMKGWKPEVRNDSSAWEELISNPAKVLRAVATDTIAFGQQYGGALGYGGNDGRKASPLKFKLGRFSTGYRIIAISDQRDGRGGNLSGAITALVNAGKPIGRLLRDAKF